MKKYSQRETRLTVFPFQWFRKQKQYYAAWYTEKKGWERGSNDFRIFSEIERRKKHHP